MYEYKIFPSQVLSRLALVNMVAAWQKEQEMKQEMKQGTDVI